MKHLLMFILSVISVSGSGPRIYTDDCVFVYHESSQYLEHPERFGECYLGVR